MASANSIKMGQGHVTLGVDRGPLDAGLEAAKGQFQSWGKGIMALGAGIAAAGASVAAPFLAGLGDFITWGGEMRGVMRETSMSFSEAQLAMNGFRISGDELPGVVAKMSEFLVAARDGGAEANRTLQMLGLSVAVLDRMTTGERLNAFADGLNRIRDSAQRIATTRDIFGRGGLAINFDGGAAGAAARAARMRELQGESRSEEAQRAAGLVGRARSEMGIAVGAISQSLSYAAAPIMEEFFQLVTKVAIAVRQWTDENRSLLTTIFYLADKLIWVGVAIGAVGTAIYGASYAFEFIQGAIAIVGGLLSWVGGVVMVGVNFILGTMSLLLGAASTGFGLLTLASATWGVLASTWTAIVTGATTAYGTVLWALIPVFAILKAASWFWGISSVIALYAISAAYTVYVTAIGIATAATNIYTLALIAAWIWENLVSLGLNLIASGLIVLATAIVAVGIVLWSVLGSAFLLTLVGPAIGAVFLSIASGAARLASSTRESIGGVGAYLSGFFSQVGAYFSQFFTGIVEQASEAFGNVSEIVMQTFETIKNFMAAGEMDLVWETLVASAELAWMRIYPVVLAFKDGVVDMFRSMWAEALIFGLTAWQKLKEFIYPILAQMLNAFAISASAIPGMEGAANRAINMAAQLVVLPRTAEQIRQDVEAEDVAQWRAEQMARFERDAALEDGNAERAAELQAHLDDLQMYAEFLQAAAGGGAAIPGVGRRPGGGDDIGKTSSAGTFSRYAAAGFLGAMGFDSETRAEREARLAREHLAELVRIANRQRGVVMR